VLLHAQIVSTFPVQRSFRDPSKLHAHNLIAVLIARALLLFSARRLDASVVLSEIAPDLLILLTQQERERERERGFLPLLRPLRLLRLLLHDLIGFLLHSHLLHLLGELADSLLLFAAFPASKLFWLRIRACRSIRFENLCNQSTLPPSCLSASFSFLGFSSPIELFSRLAKGFRSTDGSPRIRIPRSEILAGSWMACMAWFNG
jgi:hypothetical protein